MLHFFRCQQEVGNYLMIFDLMCHPVYIPYSLSDGLIRSGHLLSVSILPRARVLQVVSQNRETGTGQS